MRRSKQIATLASLTDFHTERQEQGRAHPSMIDLPCEVWAAMVANSKRIVWPGQTVECHKEVIVNERGEEEAVDAGPAQGRPASKAAMLNAAIRCGHHWEPAPSRFWATRQSEHAWKLHEMLAAAGCGSCTGLCLVLVSDHGAASACHSDNISRVLGINVNYVPVWSDMAGGKCRLQKTKRLRQLFEQMDKHKTGTLTLDQFREYMARENPRSVKRAAEIFAAMQSKHQEHVHEDACKVPTVSFLEVLDPSAC